MAVLDLERRIATVPTSGAPVERSRLNLVPAGVALICVVQALAANLVGANANAFEDEATYVYIGHRMIEHLLHGARLTEYPSTYFSGAPGMYPVLAALGDSVGGLQGARTVSLVFALGATVFVYGLTRELFGKTAGLLGAAAFAMCGSVLFQSHFATYDSMASCLVAAAAWLAVRSTKRDSLLWAPAVGVLLGLAFLTKYGTGIFTPVVLGLAIAVGWRSARWKIVLSALYAAITAAAGTFVVIELWGRDLVSGIAFTTTNRVAFDPADGSVIVHQVLAWFGVALVLGLLGGLLRWRDWRIVAVLLVGSIVVPAQQIRIGEDESLAKHLAFGMIFLAPLVGHLMHRFAASVAWVGPPVTVVGLLLLGVLGLHLSHVFLTTWVDDRDLAPSLRSNIAAAPGKAILGEQPAPQRYELRKDTRPQQWNDTYSFKYAGRTGYAAYTEAIDQSHFGVIYLSMTTTNGRLVHDYLTNVRTPYVLTSQVNRYLHGKVVGKWLVYTPRVLHETSGVPAG